MKTVCGLDVHKDSVFVCIMKLNGEKVEKKFGVTTPELLQLQFLMEEHIVEEAAIESTGVYWQPIWKILTRSIPMKLVNPYFIKQLPGRKSDVKDAEWIATVLQKELIRSSFVPDEQIQTLRQYGRRVCLLTKQKVKVENAIHRQLHSCNIRITNYISATNSVAMQKIIALLIEGKTAPNELLKCVHTRTKNKHGLDVLRDSLTGDIQQVDIDMLSQYNEELQLVEKQIEESYSKMKLITDEKYSKEVEQLKTIPGIKEHSAMRIIAEIGVDMGVFPTASNIVSWAGFNPRNDESAGVIKSRKTTHGNKYLRQLLIQCAYGGSRTKGCRFQKKYASLLGRRKVQQKALVAIARQQLAIIWILLDRKQNYMNAPKK